MKSTLNKVTPTWLRDRLAEIYFDPELPLHLQHKMHIIMRVVRKEKRGMIDRTCRNHGSCKRCEDTRTYQARKEAERVEHECREYQQAE